VQKRGKYLWKEFETKLCKNNAVDYLAKLWITKKILFIFYPLLLGMSVLKSIGIVWKERTFRL